jgi:hypothetical protein
MADPRAVAIGVGTAGRPAASFFTVIPAGWMPVGGWGYNWIGSGGIPAEEVQPAVLCL